MLKIRDKKQEEEMANCTFKPIVKHNKNYKVDLNRTTKLYEDARDRVEKKEKFKKQYLDDKSKKEAEIYKFNPSINASL